jgi:hypothetical protein
MARGDPPEKESERGRMKEDRWIGLILFGFSFFMYLQTLEFPRAMFGTLGAGFFPRILFVLLGLTGALLSIDNWLRDRRGKRGERMDAGGAKGRPRNRIAGIWRDHSQVILSLVMVFLYIVGMHYLGYLMATLFFMLTLMWFLGPRRRKDIPMVVGISCGMTFLIYFSFLKLLQIFLPEGVLF